MSTSPGLQPLDHLPQLGAVAARAGGLLGIDLGAAGGLEFGQLAVESLSADRESCG
jgi:hypothetical protein